MIGFCHLPKTGGTSLVQGMRNAGMNVWVPTPPEGVEPWNVGNLKGDHLTWDQSPPKGTDVVAGHISAYTFDQFPEVTEWVTVVRHPVVRWLSHWYWINRNRAGNWNTPPSDLMALMYGWHGYAEDHIRSLLSQWWFHSELEQAAAWFGVALPEARHKATMRPERVDAVLASAVAAANPSDVELWEWFTRE